MITGGVIQEAYSALEKINGFSENKFEKIKELYGIWEETISFQVVCRFEKGYEQDSFSIFSADCPECELEIFQVEDAPCSYPCAETATGAYLTREKAMIPDILVPYENQPVRLNATIARSFWIDVKIPKGASSTNITLTFSDRKGHIQSQFSIPVQIFPVSLPKKEVHYAEWFHCDCLCHQYGCQMFSDEFFEIAENYIKCAVKHGIDTLLTPVFTPSLDIEPFGKRLPGQLVNIKREKEQISYDFSLFHRWVEMAKKCGIKKFEIAPFFTQWGAKCAAEIYETTEDGLKTLFGWNTEALSVSYADFLADFLPQFIKELKKEGIKENTYFHVSDEPSLDNLDNYKAARNMIKPYIEDCLILDALSEYSFLKEGLVDVPVVAENHLTPFLESERKGELWTYFCCSQDKVVPNLFLSMPSLRGRILGVLLYKEKIDGLLHWGYNFWNSQFSKEPIDPYRVTDAGLGFPSGDGFLVYPGKDKKPVPSIRLKVMRDAFQDYGVLQLLEKKIGREEVLKFISQRLGEISFFSYPEENRIFIEFRKELMGKIVEYL